MKYTNINSRIPSPGPRPLLNSLIVSFEVPAIPPPDIPPGPLAYRIRRLEFRVARTGDWLMSLYLELLVCLPSLREPRLRKNSLSMQSLERMIGESLYHVESAMMQIVGMVNRNRCIPCRQRLGPWSECVTVPEIPGLCCSNCHWQGNLTGCRYPLVPLPPLQYLAPPARAPQLPPTPASPMARRPNYPRIYEDEFNSPDERLQAAFGRIHQLELENSDLRAYNREGEAVRRRQMMRAHQRRRNRLTRSSS